ncbi:hypothetical protein, partial [Lutimaribacter saemankumensis]
ETISSGLGRLFAILGPPFPKHSGGPVQLGRLNGMLKFITIVGYICIFLAVTASAMNLAAALIQQLLIMGMLLVVGTFLIEGPKD